MSDEVEYIEPTQEHVGQIVEVGNSQGLSLRPRQLLAVLPSEIPYRFICRDHVDSKSVTHWKYARIARKLTYAERQAKCGLKVGDRVRIVCKAHGGELDWKVHWNTSVMDAMVGNVYKIVDIDDTAGVLLAGYRFPYFVLEKVEDRKAVHDDYGRIVYVADCPQDEFKLVTTFCEVVTEPHSCTWFGVVRSGDKRFVYELSNLRVKE